MTPEARTKLKNLLIKHEQLKQFPYVDKTGHLTIGIGRNLTTRGVSVSESLYLCDDDILYFTDKLNQFVSFFNLLSDNRKTVLVDICFNVGVNGLLNFKNMLSALENSDFDKAAEEILDSKAAQQCPERYQQLAQIMKTDEL
jgi:lysozyme